MNRLTPNLFVPGSSKCGSTSLHYILGQHPDIHACRTKEPTFFSWPFQLVRNPIEYFQLFDSSKRYRLDSSTNYLINPSTPPLLHSLFPDARFVVSLRHPKARAYSLYRNMRRYRWESISSFSEALKAEADRFHSIDFFSNCTWDFWQFQYCRSTLYDEQLSRYFALFERKQFCIISLAELSKEPLSTIERILCFLDLDPTPAQQFDFAVKHKGESFDIQHQSESENSYDEESDQIMNTAFAGLIERTEALIGHPLDWSL